MGKSTMHGTPAYEQIEFLERRVTELEADLDYLKYFHNTADFGPAHEEVVLLIQQAYEQDSGFRVPAHWRYDDWMDDDGQPDEYQENQDFAQDGEFENTSAEDIL